MEAPTMVYALPGKEGGKAQGDLWYKVVDASEVKDCLKDGWVKEPGDLKRKRGPNKVKDI